MIFEHGVDRLYTYDAYYKNVVFENGILVIPFVNLGVSQHPIQPSRDLVFLDRCFVVCEQVDFLQAGKHAPIVDNTEIDMDSVIRFEGTAMAKSIYNDLAVHAKKIYLQTLPDTRTSSMPWRPSSNPHIPSNVPAEMVKTFFDAANFPDNIKAITTIKVGELV